VNKVLTWVRKNVLVVLFAAVMIAAPTAMWFVASGMNAKVRADVAGRVKKLDDLEALKKTQISVVDYVPGGATTTGAGIVNERLIQQLREVTDLRLKDAEQIRALAVAHNRKDRGVLLPELFPAPAFEYREVMPSRFYDRLMAAYDRLLEEVDAGEPPDPQRVQEEISAARTQFSDQMLVKAGETGMADEDLAKVREKLSETRLAAYTREAEGLRFYCGRSALHIPAWDQKSPRAPAELFDWQWQFWVNEDILRALGGCNAADASMLTAPVKRVVEIRPLGAAASSAVQSAGTGDEEGVGGEGGGMGFGMGPGGGRGRNMPGESGQPAATAPAAPLDPMAEAALHFDRSITGRVTNPLYDVRRVELVVIVESARVPQVINGLTSYNFITVTELQLDTVDPFTSLNEGYVFGAAPVSQVTMTLETVWLREWITPFMPEDLKRILGIPTSQEPAATG
jgi:hypothetical protein